MPINNLFVLPGGGGNAGQAADCRSLLGFRSVLPTSSITGDNSDPIYPISNMLDYRDNTQYSPNETFGTITITFEQSSESEIDYIGLGIHNGLTAGMTLRLEVQIGGNWQQVATISPSKDNKTECEYFNPVSCLRQRVIITYSNKLFIGALQIGKAWVFKRTPNIGFRPANWGSVDRVKGFRANTGQFIIGRRKEVGYSQSGEFSFIETDDMNANYIEYMNHVKDSKPFFMKWLVSKNESVYGQHPNPNGLRAPEYTNSFYSTFNFDIVGYN